MPTVFVDDKVYQKISKLSILLKLKYKRAYSRGKAIEWMYDQLSEKIKELEQEVMS